MARKKSTVAAEEEAIEVAKETKASNKLTLSNPSERTVQEDRTPTVRPHGKFTIITY